MLMAQPYGVRLGSLRSGNAHGVALREEERKMLGIVLVLILVLALCGAVLKWRHSRNWGYYPSGGLGLALLIVVVLMFLGRI